MIMSDDQRKQDGSGVTERHWLMTAGELRVKLDADRERSNRSAILLAGAFVVSAATMVIAAVLLDDRRSHVHVAPVLILAGFFVVAAAVGPVVILTMCRARGRRWSQRQRECEEFESVVEGIKDERLGRLISFNFRLMDRFVAVALAQARASFLACSIAASAALLVLLSGIAAVAALPNNVGAQITAGLLTAAGTALSGFLSLTFLRTFAMTSRQMSYYYGQPLVHCY